MKKILFLSAFVMFGTANSQVNFGAKGGMNVANLTGDIDDNKAKIGFYVGPYANVKIVEKLSFQPELLFSTQGTKVERNFPMLGGVADLEHKLNLTYLNIPLMLQYELTKGFKVEFGPQVGFLLSAKNKWEESYNGALGSLSDSGKQDIKDDTKTIDFGLNVGANYELENGINFSARYNFGLTKINDGDGKVKNGVFSFGVGYTFKK